MGKCIELLTPGFFYEHTDESIDDEPLNWDCEIVDDVTIHFVITTITMKRFNAWAECKFFDISVALVFPVLYNFKVEPLGM